jgi:hypothetical protein
MLLFFDKLSDSLKTWFVPSLVGYLLGASLLGYLHIMLSNRREGIEPASKGILPPSQFWTIVICHGLWFVCFISYNFYRGSI